MLPEFSLKKKRRKRRRNLEFRLGPSDRIVVLATFEAQKLERYLAIGVNGFCWNVITCHVYNIKQNKANKTYTELEISGSENKNDGWSH